MSTPPNKKSFWDSVRELAAMRAHIPEERRALSGMRALITRWQLEFERGRGDES